MFKRVAPQTPGTAGIPQTEAMTSRPAAPDSETPEVDALLLEYKDVPFEDEWKCAFAMYDLARSLERRLSLAQTEIKGHMRNEGDLLNELALARADWACAQTRIAELEKVLIQVREEWYGYTPYSKLKQDIDAALKSSA